MRRVLVCSVVFSLVAASLTTPALARQDRRASASVAESVRVLLDVTHVASAVDAAGGSLVAGAETASGADRDGTRVYHRTPGGTWQSSTRVLAESRYPTSARLGDIAVSAGPSGFYVVVWTMHTTTDTGVISTAYASTRSPSGEQNPIRRLFSSTFAGSDPDPEGADLRLTTNAHGDAALSQVEPRTAARYLRNTGWTEFPVPTESGETPAGKRDAVVMMTTSRTLDITYAVTIGGVVNVVERFWPQSAKTSDRRALVCDGVADLRYAATRDDGGRLRLIVDETTSADGAATHRVRRFSEANPRGQLLPGYVETGPPGRYGAPTVAARGKANRYDLSTSVDSGVVRRTVLYDPFYVVQTDAAHFDVGERVHTPLAIGVDGRGVEVGFGGYVDGVPRPASTVQRVRLERTAPATVETMATDATGRPALDVGRSGVSQLVIPRAVTTSAGTVRQTYVYVRR